jgi:hypothetical protein
MLRQVIVHNNLYDVSTRKSTKTDWVACGSFMGEHYDAKGRIESAALRSWAEWARNKTKP